MAPWAPQSYISLSEHFRLIEAKSEAEKSVVGHWPQVQKDWETDSGIGESPPPTPSTPTTDKTFNMSDGDGMSGLHDEELAYDFNLTFVNGK